MKRNIYLLSALAGLAIFTTSCSDDDNDNTTVPFVPAETELYTSSNTSGRISVTNLDAGADMKVTTFANGNDDCDGIYYNAEGDYIIQASRTKNRLNQYSDIQNKIETGSDLALDINSSDLLFSNAREIAVSGNKVFVVQDQSDANGLANKIFVFEKSETEFVIIKTYNVDFKLWGIHVDGNNLYAVVDNTGDFVRFDNILSQDSGLITPSKRLNVEGLVRTHGITYSSSDDRMVLTDVGSATSDTDGGIVIIENFTSVFNGLNNNQMIGLSAQKRIYGASTTLGNPVDVAYDDDTKKIYVAERLNAGGRVLTFDYPTLAVTNITPAHARAEAGVSAVYLSKR